MSLLTGAQIGEFQDLLCEYFGIEELVRMSTTRLDQTLENIVAVKGQSKQNIAFAFIEWLEHRELTLKFLQAVRDERREVSRVRVFCDPFLTPPSGGTPASGTQGGSTGPADARLVLIRVVEFRTLFDQRRIWFKYLNANKTLHDVLHKLQEQKVGLTQAAERFRRAPDDPLELKIIADKLDDELVSDAKAALPNTEFPDEPGKWVAAFDRTVQNLHKSLAPPDLDTLDRAVEVLCTLHNQQAGLNGELIRCAKRLKTDELVQKMEVILAGLGQIPAAKADDLRAGLTRFQGLCQRLAALTLDHDACQEVEISLAAVGTNASTPANVFQWPDVLAALLRITARRPEDRKADRMAEYARAFDTATDSKTATAQFTLLWEQFGRLFYKTDEDLLDVTSALVSEADRLGIKLEGFA